MAVFGEKEVAAPLERLAAARTLPVVPLAGHNRHIRYVRQNENRRDFLIPAEEPEKPTEQHTKNKPAWNEKRSLKT